MSGMSESLAFDIFAIDRASAVFTRVGAAADGTAAKVDKGSAVMGTALLTAGSAALALGVKSVAMAASFDASITRLTTTAGESPKALGMVSQGILDMAGHVGYSAQELATAMYQVESGGFHGAAALKVLSDAAQGARVEGANVTDVAHALSGALNDYRGTSLTATEATNAMTAAVGHGMMTFQDLAEAMPKVGARAAAAKVTFAEMTAAVGTMTKDGLPAAVAATYLGQSIGQLAAPSAKAQAEMRGLGINSTELAATLTSGSGHGLGDALKMLYDGIQRHLVGGGLVSVDTFRKMSKSTTDYQKVLADLPPTIQTQVQALANASGGVRSFQGVLMLGGQHAGQYAETLKGVNDQIHKGGTEIAGFSEVQKNLATQWADLKGSASALGVEIGNDLMPAALDVTHTFQDLIGFLQDNKGTVEAVGITAASVAGALVLWKVAALGVAAAESVAGLASAEFATSEAAVTWGLVTATFAADGAAAGFEMLGAAMEATPIGLIAAAVGGLSFGLFELGKALFGAEKPSAAVRDLQGILNTKFNEGIGPLKSLNVQAFNYADALGNVGGQLKIVNAQQAMMDALRGAKAVDPHTHMNALDAASTLGIPEMQLAKMLSGQARGSLADLQQQYDHLKNSTNGYLTSSKELAAKALDELGRANTAALNARAGGQRAAATLRAQAAVDKAAADNQMSLYQAQNKSAQSMLTILAATKASTISIQDHNAATTNQIIQTAIQKGSLDGLARSMGNGFTVGEELARSMQYVTDNAAANKTNIDNLIGTFSRWHMTSGEVKQALADLGLTGTELGNKVTAGMTVAEKSLWTIVPTVTAIGPQLQSATTNLGNMADQGLAAGLVLNIPAVTSAASLVADRAVNKMNEVLQVHSPSRRTQQIGQYVVDGLVVGMTRGQHLAEEAANQIAAAMHKSLMQGLRVEELQLGFDLTAAQAAASKANAQVQAATSWADGFKSNVFTQGFTGTGGAGSSSYTSGGVAFTLTGGPGGSGGIVQQMLAYEKQQATKNTGLFHDISRLRKLGLSAGLIAQMQQGGDSGISEIQALATATKAEIQQMNSLYAQSNNALMNAGAEAVAGKSMKQLQTYAQRRADTVADIKKAIQGVKLEIADGGKYVRIT